tara:strand:- start:144 stop:422 length:279 start_codon:yes stop_codon:yes gene_type:complete
MSTDYKNKEVISPCISICRTDPRSGYCYGCARTDGEKRIWKDEKTNVIWKKENLQILIQRMSGWQLETFKESYNHKIRTGLSLFKKNQIKKD